MLNKFITIMGVVFATPFFCFSQENLNISLDSISKDFIKDSNIITVDKRIDYEIINQSNSREKFSEICLILDKSGLSRFRNGTDYDNLTKINHIEISIYDAKGKFIQKINESDFSDITLIDGYSIYNDNRGKYAKINYSTYPFFAKVDYTKTNNYTTFITPFFALQSEKHKVLKTEYSISYPKDFNLKTFEVKLDDFNIDKKIESNKITYSGKNLLAPEYEQMNIRYLDLLPEVRFSLDRFSIANIKGEVNNWDEFGIWYYKNFLQGLDDLPNTTVSKMKNLTDNATSDLEKVKIIFDYVQKNTRYISIQTGIGGWKPFSAKEVDKLKYGDCKALTNYTKALLKAVGVESYYTILNASDKIKDIDENMITMQGNHVILTYPHENGFVFLECTNQNVPFGYLSSMIDNRKVLMISENGAKIITTKSFKQDTNSIEAEFVIDMSKIDEVKTEATIGYQGLYYNEIYHLNVQNTQEVLDYVKGQFSNYKELKIINTEFFNNKEEIQYIQKLSLSSTFIGSKAGNDYLIQVNPFYKLVDVPKRYKERKSDFQVSRNRNISISTKYILPQDFKLSFVPTDQEMNTLFGSYKIQFVQSNNELIVSEIFNIQANNYTSNQFEAYREFVSNVQKNNMSKFIITKL